MQHFRLLQAGGSISRCCSSGPGATLEEWLGATEYILAGGNGRRRTITRAEAATMLGRSLGVADKWVTPGAEFPDGRFQPHGVLTRAQAAKILARYLGL